MNKTALITGAGSGIGQALTFNLAEKGINVIAIGRRLEPLEATQDKNPDRIAIISADVSDAQGRQEILRPLKMLDNIDYFIPNAGTNLPMALLKDMKLKEWRQAFATNLEGPLFLLQALLPQLKNSRVLHISSGLAHFAMPYFGAYCASKAALYMLYLQCKEEFKEDSLYFGSVMPGMIDSPMQTAIRDSDIPVAEYFRELKENNKAIAPEVCANFLSWLLIETSDQLYSEKEWDIYDTSHHKHWLKDIELPMLD